MFGALALFAVSCETVAELAFETVRPLLPEEYASEDVDAFRPHVEACIAAVQAEIDFRSRVVAACSS
jgi:hypothetical protein